MKELKELQEKGRAITTEKRVWEIVKVIGGTFKHKIIFHSEDRVEIEITGVW